MTLPVVLFQCLLWPWSKTTTGRIDSLQAHLIARLLRLPGRDGEPRHIYFQRRNRAAGDFARRHGTWSRSWGTKIKAWVEHLDRHLECWVSRLLLTRNCSWLEGRRSLYASGAHTATAGRTRTRVIQQRVHLRYEAGLKEWHKAA